MCEVIKARDREEKRRHLGLEGREDVPRLYVYSSPAPAPPSLRPNVSSFIKRLTFT